MDTKIRCQSCGMPLGEDFYGTSRDGSDSQEYCRFCFQNGHFTSPDETVETMIQKSIKNMTEGLSFSQEKANKVARNVIPTLRRWIAKNKINL